MTCKYPIILVHGIGIKQTKVIKAFGKIEQVLDAEGHRVYVADVDAFGTIETNAEQLKKYVLKVLEETGAEKVNVIGHSKGGLDTKYMINELDMEDKVASLTTLCTPHRGSIVASWIWKLPGFIKRFMAFCINFVYKRIGDENPNALRACDQLRWVDESEETLRFSEKVYCQSYSTNLKRGRDCFILGIPMKLYRHFEKLDNDGLVCHDSTKFGFYRGHCLDISVSHAQIVDLFTPKKKKEKVYDFYRSLCAELADMGF
ncbi:MAG: alpha/beta fold hydrolase [Clostridia bacterium]|nr:alpha/beta fold hydrolase [Clostridia bacterium]